MIPKTDIIYNYEYAKRLYRGTDNFEDVWRRIIGIGADFEKVYEKYGIFILETIEKYSGFSWEEHSVATFPIYLADVETSMVHPLTIRIDEQPELMLDSLIYQLANRNMYFGFTDDMVKEKCLRSVTNQVKRDLKLLDEGSEKDDIDLKQITIRQYLKK